MSGQGGLPLALHAQAQARLPEGVAATPCYQKSPSSEASCPSSALSIGPYPATPSSSAGTHPSLADDSDAWSEHPILPSPLFQPECPPELVSDVLLAGESRKRPAEVDWSSSQRSVTQRTAEVSASTTPSSDQRLAAGWARREPCSSEAPNPAAATDGVGLAQREGATFPYLRVFDFLAVVGSRAYRMNARVGDARGSGGSGTVGRGPPSLPPSPPGTPRTPPDADEEAVFFATLFQRSSKIHMAGLAICTLGLVLMAVADWPQAVDCGAALAAVVAVLLLLGRAALNAWSNQCKAQRVGATVWLAMLSSLFLAGAVGRAGAAPQLAPDAKSVKSPQGAANLLAMSFIVGLIHASLGMTATRNRVSMAVACTAVAVGSLDAEAGDLHAIFASGLLAGALVGKRWELMHSVNITHQPSNTPKHTTRRATAFIPLRGT